MKAQTYFSLLVFVAIIIGSCNQQNQQSIVEEYTETLLTYPYHDTNSFPIIQNKNDIYPYSRIDGFSHKEIADMLGIREGTSKWHLSFARKKLTEMMQNAIQPVKTQKI